MQVLYKNLIAKDIYVRDLHNHPFDSTIIPYVD